MRLFHIPYCSIQNKNVHISVLNGALWDMEQVHSGICELGQFFHMIDSDAICLHSQHNGSWNLNCNIHSHIIDLIKLFLKSECFTIFHIIS